LLEKIILGGEKMKKFHKGQSTLEYVIILAAVVGAIIAIAATLSNKVTSSYNSLGDKVNTTVTNLTF
jgi:Flp pilus assembly pilin Flp